MQGRVRTSSSRLARVIICSLLTVMLIPMPVAAIEVAPEPTTYYVDVYNQGASDGSMIAPFPTITEALDQASPGDTIMVAAGHYTPITGERMPLQLLPGITLKSVAGSSETTIDAMFEDTAIMFYGDQAWEQSDVPPEMALDLPITVEGFAVTNGFAGGIDSVAVEPARSLRGGCLSFFYAPATTLRDLVVTNGVSEDGGGLTAEGTDLTVEDCAFISNGYWPAEPRDGGLVPSIPGAGEPATWAGGAMFLNDSVVSISGTMFVDNVARMVGGAIESQESTITISDCEAYRNFALPETVAPGSVLPAGMPDTSGGFVSLRGSSLVARSLVATGNLAAFGGVVSADVLSDVSLTESSLMGNMAMVGGGVSQTSLLDLNAAFIEEPILEIPVGAPLLVEQCVFQDNLGLDAAAIVAGTGLVARDSLFVGNEGPGVTLAALPGSMIEGSTFTKNMTEGGVFYDWEGLLLGSDLTPAPFVEVSELVNSIVWDNFESGVSAESVLPIEPPAEETVLESVIGGWFAAYSDVQGSFEGTACISTDPMFTDPDAGDYRLAEGSPCIDAGTWETDSAVDLDGLVRPVDGDFDGAEDFDMGAYESAGPRMERLGGVDRYETSVEVSAERFTSADTVVIATGRVFADGLAAAGLAGAYDAPLLLTGSDYLPAVVADEIVRLGAESAIVVGGTNAVDGEVFQALADMDLDVTRIGGVDRYETAALLAEEIRSVMGDDMAPVAFVARGDLYPDALAVSPVAYAMGAPILLVRPDELPESTVDVISEMGIASVVVAGGTSAVGVSVAGDIAEAGATVKRINGADRYETAAMFAEFAVEQGWASYTVTGLATGAAFPDALSGGAALGKVNGVLLLTPRDTLAVPTSDVLTARADVIIYLRTLGGSAAVSLDVQAAAEAIVE